MLIQRVRVRVPGTTANLGPGFDCLGIALGIYNDFTVARAQAVVPEPMIDQAAAAFFERAGQAPFAYRWSIEGEVPRSRGLGSSVTVRLGLLHGLNELCGLPLKREDVFRLCAALEGHPDNAAPAAFGGFTVAGQDGRVARFDVDPALKFVLLIPDFETETTSARKVMPKSLSVADAVFSLGNACALTAAFASRNYEALRGAFADKIHQPYRTPLIPFLPDVLAAAEKAGALGGFLSGSGSTIAAVTLQDPQAVAAAMSKASGLKVSGMRIVTADNAGAQTLEMGS
ncbi:MAG TPA: homoserine kinase [Chthoniobacterales bacterium]